MARFRDRFCRPEFSDPQNPGGIPRRGPPLAPGASAFAPQEIRRHAKADPVWRTKRRRFPAPDIRGDDARADRPPVRLSNPLFRRQATVSNADW